MTTSRDRDFLLRLKQDAEALKEKERRAQEPQPSIPPKRQYRGRFWTHPFRDDS
jgi:hypothetical protein